MQNTHAGPGNKLTEGARSGRPPAYWRVALYVLAAIVPPLALAIGTAAALVFAAVAIRSAGSSPPSPEEIAALTQSPGLMAAVLSVFELGIIAMTLLWVRVVDRRPVATIGLKTRRPFGEWLRGLGLGAGLMGLSVGGMALLGAVRLDGHSFGNPVALLGVGGMLLLFLVQGPAEEVMFRGYLLPVLGARGTLVIGIVVSSVLFGLLHALNPNFGMLPLVNITLAGVTFALYALVEEGLWGVFGFHSAWNWVQGNVLGLAVSGGAFGPSALQLSANGPPWLTGGAFGPEGSVLVTVLLAALSAVLGWRLWQQGRPTSGPPETGT